MSIMIPNPTMALFSLAAKYFLKDAASLPDAVPSEHRRVFSCLPERSGPGFDLNSFFSIFQPWWLQVITSLLEEKKIKNMKFFAISDAKRHFTFTPGHPQVGELYIQHPLDENRYLLAKDYLRVLYEEKANEFLLILAELAVCRVEATYLKGVERLAGFTANVSENQNSIGGNLKVEHGLAKGVALIEDYTPSHPPRKPEGPDFRWLSHEVSWQSLVRRRIDGGLKNSSIQFCFTGMASLSGETAIIVKNLNANIGLDIKYSEQTEWELNLNFSPSSDDLEKRPKILERVRRLLTWR